MESQCHLDFLKPGIQMQSWGRPPGLRGSPWTRSSPVKSDSSKPSKPTWASAADQGVRPTKECKLSNLGKTKCDDWQFAQNCAVNNRAQVANLPHTS